MASKNCKREMVAAFAQSSDVPMGVLTGARGSAEVARLLGVAKADVDRLCAGGVLVGSHRPRSFGEAAWMIKDSDLLAFLREAGREWFDGRLRCVTGALAEIIERSER